MLRSFALFAFEHHGLSKREKKIKAKQGTGNHKLRNASSHCDERAYEILELVSWPPGLGS